MAKVTLPLMSGQAKNKIGDIVFYRRGDFGINVARIRVKPHNPRTPRQIGVRTNIGTFSKIYTGRLSPGGITVYKRNIMTGNFEPIQIANTEIWTDADKMAWENYTHVTKQGYKVKGRLAFIGVNVDRLNKGLNPWKIPGVEFNIA
ncbi:MAG: hypothetical protein QXS63_01140 [Zestosphaera sp.]